ncbi:MAG: carbamoyltransferase HypF [Anaerolineae bacterium]|nr:carbamoyltransferase HypF [Anaerolineae bacterium]
MNTVAYRIAITGVVQGVGFRPFVYTLAQRLGVRGWVLNHSGGVDIEAEGEQEVLTAFITALRAEAPPLARIASLETFPVAPNGHTGFGIRHSEAQAGRFMLISPDVATCPECLRELLDPADRRYRYPFINCTNCGPRFTIIEDIPYDRASTTMRVFLLCDTCRAEYTHPADRRFHAQPNACPVCGPHIWMSELVGQLDSASTVGEVSADSGSSTEETLRRARELLLSGGILAIKGLGGFQLACDATNAAAVQRLRTRKRRPHKPFAVMVATLADARAVCEVSSAEAELLTSPQAPIVLLRRLPAAPDGAHIAEAIAPHQHTLGLMLPYTPLHHLLLRDVGRPLVMTSGNLSEEPIAKDNAEALERLSGIADAFLFHNRDIYARYDDSVVRVSQSVGVGESPNGHESVEAKPALQVLRRARGYAPYPVALPFEVGRVFAAGPLLKNTFTLTRDQYAFVSQHIGDLENLETLEHYEAALATYLHLFRIEPERVVCDLHPDYLSTRFAVDFARAHGLPAPLRVQHHQAHIAACLADNGWSRERGPVIGVALDGTGYGDDGTIWGGEWFVGDYDGMRRSAHLEPLPLPGGDAAIRQPWRIALAYLNALVEPEDFPAEVCFAGLCPGDAGLIREQIARGFNVPQTSSMGRLFDAVSALLGVCSEVSYEAQAAIELEQLASLAQDWRPYPFAIEGDVVRLAPLFYALLESLERGVPIPDMAARFHATIARMVLEVCLRLREETGLLAVALSGGVFQNALLLDLTVPVLRDAGFEVLLHHQVPCNDGGISLGQCAYRPFSAL